MSSKKVLVLGASSSANSINKHFATFAAKQISGLEFEVIDLKDYDMPVYSVDREQETGFPEPAKNFSEKLKSADAIIISFAEHNGSYTAAFKNTLDWASRVDMKSWDGLKALLLATSPGPRGGLSVLESAKAAMPFWGVDIKGSFSLPSYFDNFKDEKIASDELEAQFNSELSKFKEAL